MTIGAMSIKKLLNIRDPDVREKAYLESIPMETISVKYKKAKDIFIILRWSGLVLYEKYQFDKIIPTERMIKTYWYNDFNKTNGVDNSIIRADVREYVKDNNLKMLKLYPLDLAEWLAEFWQYWGEIYVISNNKIIPNNVDFTLFFTLLRVEKLPQVGEVSYRQVVSTFALNHPNNPRPPLLRDIIF